MIVSIVSLICLLGIQMNNTGEFKYSILLAFFPFLDLIIGGICLYISRKLFTHKG